MWVVFISCWLALFFDLSYKMLNKLINKDLNFDIYSFYTFAEYSLIALFFYYTFRTPAFKKALIICSILFYIISPLNIIYYRDLSFDSLTFSTEAAFVVIFSILYFYEQLIDPNVTFFYGTKSFWIIIGLLLYTTIGLFPYITKPFLSHKEQRMLAPIPFLANVLKYVLFAISFRILPPVSKR